ASIGSGTVHLRLRDSAQRDDAQRVLASALGAAVQTQSDPFALTARVTGNGDDVVASEQASRALHALSAAGIVVDEFAFGQPSLDEVFLALTARPAVESAEEEMEAVR